MATIINADTSDGLKLTSDTSGEIQFQSAGVVKAKVTANGLQDADGNSITGGMYRNLIINGDMRIDQRNTSQTGNGYSVDRWAIYDNTSATYTLAQDAEAPTDFIKSLKFTTTGTDTSIGSTEQCVIYHQIEGNNIADLNWGTANAKTVTLSFWVRSSLTGTFAGSLGNNGYARCYPFTYTISSADTWEQKTITITGDTTGTWLTTNGIGISLRLAIAAGSSFEGTSGAWASSNLFSVSGATNVVGTASSTFYITGVQLEVGSGASDFEFLPVDVQLARCQRYYEILTISTNYRGWVGQGWSTANVAGVLNYKVTKRAAPTVSSSGTFECANASFGVNLSGSVSFTGATIDQVGADFATSSGLTVGQAAMIHGASGGALVTFSAEI